MCVAVIENRAKEVGLAALDLHAPFRLHLHQFIETSSSYMHALRLLQTYAPALVLVPESMVRGSAGGVCGEGGQHHVASKSSLCGLGELVMAHFQGVPRHGGRDCHVLPVKRTSFDDTRGWAFVGHLAGRQRVASAEEDGAGSANGVEGGWDAAAALQPGGGGCYLAFGAAYAVLKYFEGTAEAVLQPGCMRVTLETTVSHVLINAGSVRSLEVVHSSDRLGAGRSDRAAAAQAAAGASLFGVMNKCRTFGGARLLRANLLQPSKSRATLEARLDAVAEIIDDTSLVESLEDRLRHLPPFLEKLLFRFVSCPKVGPHAFQGAPSDVYSRQIGSRIQALLSLRSFLVACPGLAHALESCNSGVLSHIGKKVLKDPAIEELVETINSTLDEPAAIHAETVGDAASGAMHQRAAQCAAVRHGIDGWLDVAREQMRKNTEAIQKHVRDLREALGMPALRSQFNVKRGFYLAYPSTQMGGGAGSTPISHRDTPRTVGGSEAFIQVKRSGNMTTCTTEDLCELNNRDREVFNEIMIASARVLEGVIRKVRSHVGDLAHLMESVALVDMLASFAKLPLSGDGDWVRPSFTDDGALALQEARHPIIDAAKPDAVVSNNTFLSPTSNLLVVTGPNMSGKTTLMKQVALLTIMAHVGCVVPAQFASFRLVDQICTRMGTHDSMMDNESTFLLEMKETASMLSSATPRTLYLVDELGRGTSTEDGFALAWAAAETLLSLPAFTIFVTHYGRMAELARIYPNARNCHLAVEAVDSRGLSFQYRVREGRNTIRHYGLAMADVAGFPLSIMHDARNLAAAIEAKGSAEVRSEAEDQGPLGGSGGRDGSGADGNLTYREYAPLRARYAIAQQLLNLKLMAEDPDYDEGELRNILRQIHREASEVAKDGWSAADTRDDSPSDSVANSNGMMVPEAQDEADPCPLPDLGARGPAERSEPPELDPCVIPRAMEGSAAASDGKTGMPDAELSDASLDGSELIRTHDWRTPSCSPPCAPVASP